MDARNNGIGNKSIQKNTAICTIKNLTLIMIKMEIMKIKDLDS